MSMRKENLLSEAASKTENLVLLVTLSLAKGLLRRICVPDASYLSMTSRTRYKSKVTT